MFCAVPFLNFSVSTFSAPVLCQKVLLYTHKRASHHDLNILKANSQLDFVDNLEEFRILKLKACQTYLTSILSACSLPVAKPKLQLSFAKICKDE